MLKQHRGWFVVVAASVIVVLVGVQFGGTKTVAQEKKQKTVVPSASLQWRVVASTAPFPRTAKLYRAEVPGGWLVCVHDAKEDAKSFKGMPTGGGQGLGIGISTGLTFVPDPDRNWQ